MRILIIGDAYNQYNIALVEYLKLYDRKVVVDIINTRLVNDSTSLDLRFKYDNVYHYRVLGKIERRLPKIRSWILKVRGARVIRNINQQLFSYDVLCLQGFWFDVMNAFLELDAWHIFTIGAFWGSDFYQRGTFGSTVESVLDRCDRVVISTKEMARDICNVYNISNFKIRNCIFGLAPLEELYRMRRVGRSEARAALNIRHDALVITCGYNGRPHQQHRQIIEHLATIKDILEEQQVLLLFPMTYAVEATYKESVKSLLNSLGLNYRILENYMSDQEVAYLRIATDVFIQLQVSDAFSGSMREHLFAKNIVITGAWLPYQSLIDEGIYFEVINDIESVSMKVRHVLQNIESYRNVVQLANSHEKFEMSRWPICIAEWHNAFLEYKSKNDGKKDPFN